MTIKTFDANRVGGGTFQLKQDPTTGEYTVEEVGFVKLPELKLPEIDQEPFKLPEAKIEDPITDTPVDVGGVQAGRDPGKGDGQQDFTGAQMLKNIKTEATGGDLMKQATTFAGQDIQVENIGNNPEQNSALISYNQALKVYNDAIAKADRNNPNEMNNVNEAKALVDKSREFYEKSIAPGGLFFEGTIPDAPIGDFSEGPRTVPTGTLTGAKVEDIGKVEDISKPAQKILIPEEEKTKVSTTIGQKIDTALKGLRNLSLTGLIMTAAKGTEEQQLLNKENSTALKNLGYKTNLELGITTDPGRIGGSPADNVFAGMNAQSTKGDIFQGAQRRIDNRNSAKTQERISKLSPEKQAEFNAKTAEFQKQLSVATTQRNNDRDESDRARDRDRQKAAAVAQEQSNRDYARGKFK